MENVALVSIQSYYVGFVCLLHVHIMDYGLYLYVVFLLVYLVDGCIN